MRKNLPIVLLGIALCAIVGVSGYTDLRYQGKQHTAGNGAPSAGIPEGNAGQASQEADASKQTPVWRILIAWPEGVTTLAILLTLFFIAWQAILMRQTVAASEDVSKRELRAYLTVVIGAGLFQERRPVEEGGDFNV